MEKLKKLKGIHDRNFKQKASGVTDFGVKITKNEV